MASEQKTNVGSRRAYAEQSLQWQEPSSRMRDEYLQRIWSLANDVIALEKEVESLTVARDEAQAGRKILQDRLDYVAQIIAGEAG